MAIAMKKEEKYTKDLKKCAGMYVAEVDRKIIACGKTIKEVQQKARKKNVKTPPYLWRSKSYKGPSILLNVN